MPAAWFENIMKYLYNNHIEFKNIVCIAMCFLVSYSNYLKWNHVHGFLLKYVMFKATISILLVSRPYFSKIEVGGRWLLIIYYVNEPIQSVDYSYKV